MALVTGREANDIPARLPRIYITNQLGYKMPRRYLLCSLALACAVFGQEFRATITGRVTDAQNAAVPGAKIVAILITTGAKSETTTGADGLYTIPFLTPGSYRVEAKPADEERSAVARGERPQRLVVTPTPSHDLAAQVGAAG